ncbi:hypothetical protein EJB05_03293 [Eragrostis curvula]|uniref:Methyltransferase small domain-containing protein n=1 Tax=Eragrostis curvula TaxID=38414 RepID=A0A5J9W7G3_9POAL|nr:hypothetical protein EJB05_03293 [Eragrostis curvula]
MTPIFLIIKNHLCFRRREHNPEKKIMEGMSTLPWAGNYSGTKRALAWEPAEQRVLKLRKNTSPPPAETASSFFHGGDGGDRADGILVDTEGESQAGHSEGRLYDFHGTVLKLKEFSSHALNSSVLLHGSFAFDKWVIQNRSIFNGRRVLELKSGTGALAIFLRKALGVDVTTSDFDDKEIEYGIAYNCRINSLPVLPHIQHTWGDPFPVSRPDWDIIIASNIEPYAEQSANLVKTLSFLLRDYKPKGQGVGCTTITNKSGTQVPVRFPMSLISWRRRIDPSVLFLGCENEGLEVQHLGYLVYLIQKKN